MHDFVERLVVDGLFGYVHHDVPLRVEDQITILTGVNGSGKTHVLNILRGLVGLDFRTLATLPFESTSLAYDSGKHIDVTVEDDRQLAVYAESAKGRPVLNARIRVLPDPLEEAVPSFIERLEEDLWVDNTDGELMSTELVMARYGRQVPRRSRPFEFEVVGAADEVDLSDGLRMFRAEHPPTLVETKRLDRPVPDSTRTTTRLRRPPSRIRQYVDRVREQMLEARRGALEVSQRADRQFAGRALDKARATIQESELRRQYEQLALLNEALHRNALTEPSAGVAFPDSRTNPTERRILSVFLEDWRNKLAALEPIHERLEVLRDIVGAKLVGTEIVIDSSGVQFVSSITREPVRVEQLSSGEQHLLALFTMLIFAAEPGALVLIDEPEISLHAAWKHAFLDDIRAVAELNDLQVVLATHSTAIVNGEWDLVEELTLQV